MNNYLFAVLMFSLHFWIVIPCFGIELKGELLYNVIDEKAKHVQQIVSGIVQDQDGNSLVGVTIRVKDSEKGTTTDFDGYYEINDINRDAVLVFSYVGMVSQEIRVNDRTTINVVMESDFTQIDEVVVTALGIEREKKIIGLCYDRSIRRRNNDCHPGESN